MNREPADDVKLLPCPFCGGEASISEGTQGGGGGKQVPWWYVECMKCSAMCDDVERWNARTTQPSPSGDRSE